MELSASTSVALGVLDAFSGGKLTRRSDLGLLLELSSRANLHSLLDELSFLAKFTSRTHRILQRVGRGGEGYEVLSREFSEGIEKATSLARTIIESAPPEFRRQFERSYLSLTPEAIQNLLALFYDLSWYKNWQIDHPGASLHTV